MILPARLDIALTPTPLVDLVRLSEQLGVQVTCKRDDLTGSTLSGNKVRKLEFLFAEAQQLGADTVITCGGEQSNHCRATAFAATELGMDCHLLLRTDDPTHPPASTANILLARIAGARVHWVSRPQYKDRAAHFAKLAAELTAAGRRPYIIPEGGSNALGSFGYVRCVEELTRKLDPDVPHTIIYAAGSGGTGAGLIVGCKLYAPKWRTVGINVCDDREYFVNVIGNIIERMIADWDVDIDFSREDIELVDGYVGRGYAQSRPEELRALVELARLEGIVLDPVYTGKAYFGMRSELAKSPRTFGERIVFLHTGGIFGLFPKAEELAHIL